jgi:hypothetical protein
MNFENMDGQPTWPFRTDNCKDETNNHEDEKQ